MPKITVVDDEPLILKSLVRLLRGTGCEIQSFGSAEDALSGIKAAPPDLLISDYHLPRIDGLTVLAEVRRAHPGIRTMLLSGGVADGPIADALRTGLVDHYLSKPWRSEELLETVQALLAR